MIRASYLYSLLQKAIGLFRLCFIFFEENRNEVCDEQVAVTRELGPVSPTVHTGHVVNSLKETIEHMNQITV